MSGSGGQRKFGRNEAKCARYAAEHRRVKNNPARTQRLVERSEHKGHRREPQLAPPRKPGKARREQQLLDKATALSGAIMKAARKPEGLR